MKFERFINEQKALADISLAYKNNPEFKKQLDANPKSILVADMAETECEIVIQQNSDDVFYVILSADMNQGLTDEDADNINAAKLAGVGFIYNSNQQTREALYNPENDKFYRRYKGDPTDSAGKTHFIQINVEGTVTQGATYEDIGGVVTF